GESGYAFNKYLVLLTVTGLIAFCFGALFRIMHWPGTAMLIWLGILVISIGLTLFVIVNQKQFFESLSMISVLLAILILGTFAFNFTNMSRYRNLLDAQEIINPVLEESSDQIKNYCENELRELELVAIYDSTANENLITIHTMAIAMDRNLQTKISELYDFLELAEMEEFSFDKRKSKIHEMLFASNFIKSLDEDLSRYNARVIELQKDKGSDSAGMQDYLMEGMDYRPGDLTTRYFGSGVIYSEEVINSLEIWRNRIWRLRYTLSENISGKE
ncbi:MAG: hypothetical protein IH594_09550, partial [Bacteroidales bacterium]|nr:hypothetical protein [Bacteroidales bacterium]